MENKKNWEKIAEAVADTIIKYLEKKGIGIGSPKSNRTAYQKTEALLYNYVGFKKIVQHKVEEIENLRKYGVPERSASIVEYSPHSGTVGSIVLPEESVEKAIANVQDSMADTVRAIDLVDKSMAELKNDPYFDILRMNYFEGQAQEDIATHFGVSQATVSNNKKRLVKELSIIMFPGQTAEELLN